MIAVGDSLEGRKTIHADASVWPTAQVWCGTCEDSRIAVPFSSTGERCTSGAFAPGVQAKWYWMRPLMGISASSPECDMNSVRARRGANVARRTEYDGPHRSGGS